MRLDQDFGVSAAKVEALRERIARLGLDPDAVEETASRGGGKGGQSVNKTENRVQLRYAPLDLLVSCHRERSRAVNRFLALRELVERAELRLSPGTSPRLREIARLRKRKSRSRARARAKLAPPAPPAPAP